VKSDLNTNHSCLLADHRPQRAQAGGTASTRKVGLSFPHSDRPWKSQQPSSRSKGKKEQESWNHLSGGRATDDCNSTTFTQESRAGGALLVVRQTSSVPYAPASRRSPTIGLDFTYTYMTDPPSTGLDVRSAQQGSRHASLASSVCCNGCATSG